MDPGLYPLGHGHRDAARLNLQHFLWTRHLGYLLHPSIPTIAPDLRIADIGTGTGIWLVDVSASLPQTTQLDGFDLILDKCPAAERLPPNVRVRTLDIVASPIPEELRGRYDIVNVRFFVCVVQDGDPSPVLANLHAMLKPGGYLQWAEHDATEPTILHSASAPACAEPSATPTPNLQRAAAFSATATRGARPWIRNLPTHMAAAGFEIVRADRHAKPGAGPQEGALIAYWQDQTFMAFEELPRETLTSGTVEVGQQLEQKEFEETLSKAWRESKKGPGIWTARIVCVGRKGIKSRL